MFFRLLSWRQLEKVHGCGATRSSVLGLQNYRISLKRYCFRSWVNPSGFILGGSVDAGGKTAWFFSSILDSSGVFWNSLKYTFPGSSFANLKSENLPKYLSDDIERVQKRALKIISPSMSYADNLTRFNLQYLKARREHHCRRLFSTVLSDQTHKLRALLPPENNSHYNLRTKRRFQRFVSKTNRFNNTFLPAMCNNF